MSSTPTDEESRVVHNLRAVVGWLPLIGGLVVGVVGLIVGINYVGTTGGGLYLLAGALAFGLLAIAILRE